MNRVDTIIEHGTVVTMDAERHIYPDGAVAIRDNNIVAVGPAETVKKRYRAETVFDAGGKIVTPGLINAHTHAPMTLLRGLANDLRLDVWLLGYMMPVEREFVDPDFCHWGTLLACAEMIRGGTTTFVDMYYFEDAVAKATVEAGMRAILGETILKFPSPDAASYDETLHYARQFIQTWKGHELITPTIAPHAPYTCTDDILTKSRDLALEFDVPLHIHLSETAEEVKESYHLHNMAPLAYMNSLGLFQAKTIAAHCVHIEESEIYNIAELPVGVAHNPSSNLKLASGFAPVVEMRNRHIPVGIGTDGTASNNDLDMFEEMRLTAFLPKGRSGDPTVLPAKEAFAMATIEGARAIHLDHEIGSLEPGKRADLIVISLNSPHAAPSYVGLDPENVYAHLVYATHAEDVTDVWVNGRQLMGARQLLTIDETVVETKATAFAEKIGLFLTNREANLLDKLIAIGGLQQNESFEVQIKAKVDDLDAVEKLIAESPLEVLRQNIRQQYDTYFRFADAQKGFIRYREDNVLQSKAQEGLPGVHLAVQPQYTLTLIGPTHERVYENSVILSRSRYTSPANHSLRFYREYFQPASEQEVIKWRRRFHVRYEGEEFVINLDKMSKPDSNSYVEIKSRTWSREDALHKAGLISHLLRMLHIRPDQVIHREYVNIYAG